MILQLDTLFWGTYTWYILTAIIWLLIGLALAIWVLIGSNKKNMTGWLWFLIVFLTGGIGFIVWLIITYGMEPKDNCYDGINLVPCGLDNNKNKKKKK